MVADLQNLLEEEQSLYNLLLGPLEGSGTYVWAISKGSGNGRETMGLYHSREYATTKLVLIQSTCRQI